MTNLLILGAGGHSKVLAETAFASGIADKVAFLDDRYSHQHSPSSFFGCPFSGRLGFALEVDCYAHFDAAVVAIGNSNLRLHWIKQLQDAGYHLPVLIHPTSWVSPSAQLGPASVVLAQAAVQAHASIGTGAIINTGCSVDHDSQLADGVHICPCSRLAG